MVNTPQFWLCANKVSLISSLMSECRTSLSQDWSVLNHIAATVSSKMNQEHDNFVTYFVWHTVGCSNLVASRIKISLPIIVMNRTQSTTIQSVIQFCNHLWVILCYVRYAYVPPLFVDSQKMTGAPTFRYSLNKKRTEVSETLCRC